METDEQIKQPILGFFGPFLDEQEFSQKIQQRQCWVPLFHENDKNTLSQSWKKYCSIYKHKFGYL